MSKDYYPVWLQQRIDQAKRNVEEAKRMNDHDAVLEYQARADAYMMAKMEYESEGENDA